MARQTEVHIEAKQDRRIQAAGKSIVYQLEGHLQREGIVLNGISLRIDEMETLMVLRATVQDVLKVAFVGSSDMSGCFIKATVQARDGKVNWVADKYAKQV